MTIHDIKFGRSSVKRWLVKYYFDRYMCRECKATFYSEQRPWTMSKYGPGLLSYVTYQVIELRLSQYAVQQGLEQLFDFRLEPTTVNTQKSKAAQLYKVTYEEILNKLRGGRLIHADETRISIEGKGAFVWVFTSLEEVIYYFTETREGDFLQDLLHNFQGVLVSDFYAAYDSIDCPQQKCLIHLIRDLNDDLLKQPFNEELKGLVQRVCLIAQAND